MTPEEIIAAARESLMRNTPPPAPRAEDYVTPAQVRDALRAWGDGGPLSPTTPGAMVVGPSVAPSSNPAREVLSARRHRGVLVALVAVHPGEESKPWAVIVTGEGSLEWSTRDSLQESPVGIPEEGLLRGLLRLMVE